MSAGLLLAFGATWLMPSQHEAVSFNLPLVAPQATVLFGGDLMFDRTIRQYAARYGDDYLFGCIDGALGQADLVVANLEGPITANPSMSLGSAVGSPDNFVFTFPTTTGALLARHHIGLVSLANNHIYNFKAAGVRSTTENLKAAGVPYFGDPLANTIADLDVGGVPLAFIAYNEFLSGQGASTTLAQLAEARQEGRVPVVYAHWGVEYATTAPAYVVSLAHRFVDAGAAAVIGSHPHVVEQHELYRGAPIYYSLGNVIFDQYWDAAVTHGLLVELQFSDKGAQVLREIPTVLTTDRRVCPANS